MTYSINTSGTKDYCKSTVEAYAGPGDEAGDRPDFNDAKARALAFIDRCKDGASISISISGHRDDSVGYESSSLSSK